LIKYTLFSLKTKSCSLLATTPKKKSPYYIYIYYNSRYILGFAKAMDTLYNSRQIFKKGGGKVMVNECHVGGHNWEVTGTAGGITSARCKSCKAEKSWNEKQETVGFTTAPVVAAAPVAAVPVAAVAPRTSWNLKHDLYEKNKDKIIETYQGSKTLAAAAKALHMPTSSLCSKLKQWGVPCKPSASVGVKRGKYKARGMKKVEVEREVSKTMPDRYREGLIFMVKAIDYGMRAVEGEDTFMFYWEGLKVGLGFMEPKDA